MRVCREGEASSEDERSEKTSEKPKEEGEAFAKTPHQTREERTNGKG